MDTVILRDGSEILSSLFQASMFSLRNLMEKNPISFYELVMLCRDPQHPLFGRTVETLRETGLIQPDNDQPYDVLKTIIAIAVQGDGLEMKLISPLAETQPHQETATKKADLNDFELYKMMRRIADIVFECIGSVGYVPSAKICMEDRRTEGSNPFYSQTSSGLYLEFYYEMPSTIWTPWGKWGFGGSGFTTGDGDGWHSTNEAILARLGATVHQKVRRSSMGEFGPVYALHRVDDVSLPEPNQLDKSAYSSYEDVKKAWDTLTKRYNKEVS